MIGKLFEVRQKLGDPEGFKKYLEDKELSRDDYYNLLRQAYEQHRGRFLKLAEIIRTYEKNILTECKLKQQPALFELCRNGTADEVSALLKIQSVKVLDKRGECMFHALLNQITRKNQRSQALQIVKVLHSAQPKLIHSSQNSKPLIVQAIQKQQFQVAEFLLEKGVDTSYQNTQKQNLLHILMKNYSKKLEKQVLAVRACLFQREVDDQKLNVYNKKPYQLAPPELEKKLNEQARMHNVSKTSKGDENVRYDYKNKEDTDLASHRKPEYQEKTKTVMVVNTQDQIVKRANNLVERKNKDRQREAAERERDMKEKLKEKEKKDRIVKKVFTPDELKHFLNEQISYFVELTQKQNHRQRILLDDIISKITKRMDQKFNAHLKVFGSYETKLCLVESDIDIVVLRNEEWEKSRSPFELLECISNQLSEMHEQISGVKFIRTASVPIIKVQCTKKYEEKKIDITYQDKNHNGLESVKLINEYLDIYPQLRSLIFVLKKFMYSVNIYDPYTGGLSSYGLILMIVAFMQNQIRDRKSRSGDKQKAPSTAQLLIGFLHFYGFKCNYIGKQICILEPVRARKEMQAAVLEMYSDQPIFMDAMERDQIIYLNDWQPRTKLVVVDPLNTENNVGRATHKIRQIKTAFEMAYVCIHTNKNCKSRRLCEYYQRIGALNLKDTKCENYQRPCCIINRMFNCTKSLGFAV